MRATSFVPSTLALTLRRSARVLARAPTRAGAPVDHTTTSMNNLPSPTDSPYTPSARARRRAIPSGCGSPDGVHARPPLVELHGGDDGETLGGGLKHASVATTVSETTPHYVTRPRDVPAASVGDAPSLVTTTTIVALADDAGDATKCATAAGIITVPMMMMMMMTYLSIVILTICPLQSLRDARVIHGQEPTT